MIITCCASISVIEPCCQMQTKHTMSTHYVMSQLLSLSYIYFPNSGVKLSCLTEADSCNTISAIHTIIQSLTCSLCSLCPQVLVANGPQRKKETSQWVTPHMGSYNWVWFVVKKISKKCKVFEITMTLNELKIKCTMNQSVCCKAHMCFNHIFPAGLVPNTQSAFLHCTCCTVWVLTLLSRTWNTSVQIWIACMLQIAVSPSIQWFLLLCKDNYGKWKPLIIFYFFCIQE